MTHRRATGSFLAALFLCAAGIVCGTVGVQSQGSASYRGLELGADLASVAAVAGVPPSAATVLHTRPALLQALEWRPARFLRGSSTASTDPVGRIVLSFQDGRLYRIDVHYLPERTDGMSASDVVDAVSTAFGPPLTGARRTRVDARMETEAGARIAEWGTPAQAVSLYRNAGFPSTYRLVVHDAARTAAARRAEAEALRLDERDAPRREAARQAEEREAERAAAATTRKANRAGFQP